MCACMCLSEHSFATVETCLYYMCPCLVCTLFVCLFVCMSNWCHLCYRKRPQPEAPADNPGQSNDAVQSEYQDVVPDSNYDVISYDVIDNYEHLSDGGAPGGDSIAPYQPLATYLGLEAAPASRDS